MARYEDLLLLPEPQRDGPPRGYGELRGMVVGWPRSGTGWLSECLKACGYECGHEAFHQIWGGLPDRNPVWELDVGGFSAPYTRALKESRIPLALVVRHPRELFSSIVGRWPGLSPEDAGPLLADRWVRVMDHFLEEAQFWARAEDLWRYPGKVAWILNSFGLRIRTHPSSEVKNPSRSTPGEPVPGWDTPEVLRLAGELGYAV